MEGERKDVVEEVNRVKTYLAMWINVAKQALLLSYFTFKSFKDKIKVVPNAMDEANCKLRKGNQEQITRLKQRYGEIYD